jgi:hypothetical protein
MSSNTFDLGGTNTTAIAPPASRLADALARAFLALQWLGEAMTRNPALSSDVGVQLLLRAERYEATQPSYAADLRAAAMRTMQAPR